MQDICDEIGIIVMDELFDMWTVHKNNHDFALHFLDEWEKVMQILLERYTYSEIGGTFILI
jgi:beta-galactosidase